ncbi:hypothetical protein CDL15_Pgr004698 [Punica granatum]|uniref:Uncharacterized protein n=1 Tax=Punica granatum TaxID=22663 RepID=A0A218W6F5_PUNGR|nr:hypothetical protein CDL15_Pgr004698 [Punica granatum]
MVVVVVALMACRRGESRLAEKEPKVKGERDGEVDGDDGDEDEDNGDGDDGAEEAEDGDENGRGCYGDS